MEIDITSLLQRLIMFRVGVELGPDGNHETAMEGVDAVQHAFRVRIALRIEGVTPPLVVFPILPVLHDVVHRDVAAAEFRKGTQQVLLCAVTLPALPEAQNPLGHDRRLSGQLPVALDDPVIVIGCDEIVIGQRLTFTPESEAGFRLGGLQGRYAKADVGDVAVRFPVDGKGHGLPRFQVDGELVTVGVPGRTPAAAHHFLPAHFRALETSIVLDKMVITALAGGEGPLVSDIRENALRQVPDGPFGLEIQGILLADEGLSFAGHIAALQLQVENLAQLPVWLRRAPSALGVRVEEHSVALVGNHQRDTDLGIVLVQFLAAALVVQFPGLMLSQAVKGLVRSRGIAYRGTPGLFALHLHRLEGCVAIQGQRSTIGPEKMNGSVGHGYRHFQGRGLQPQLTLIFGERIVCIRLLRQDNQAVAIPETAVGRNAHPNDLRGNHLQAYRTCFCPHFDILPLATGQQEDGSHNQRVECNFHNFNHLYTTNRQSGTAEPGCRCSSGG